MTTPNSAADSMQGPPSSTTTRREFTPSSAAPQASSPSIGASQTERPIEPSFHYPPYLRREDEPAIGNPEIVFALKIDGRAGTFYNRDRTTRIPTVIEIDLVTLRATAFRVINAVLDQLIRRMFSQDTATMTLEAASTAHQLANGFAVMMYRKLRLLNKLDERVAPNFRYKPKVTDPFEIPIPYALAVFQTGQFKVSGMTDEIYLTPSIPAGLSKSFGCPDDHPWSPIIYGRAVEVAKKIGLRFTTVDLSVKMGSSWWLYRPVVEREIFSLQCPYAEENFTEHTALLAMLFALNAELGPLNPIIPLNLLGTSVYGTMVRDPPVGLAVNLFYAIEERNEIDYKVVN